jgi:transcription elongation factor GreA
MDETVMTRDGFRRLSEELERLKTDGRRSIAERLQGVAASEANRAESADYLDARTEQARLEQRIGLLEERLCSAALVEPCLGNGRVDVGERVRVRDLVSGERLDLELVGQHEGDPCAGRISVASPLGKAILGLRRGEVVDVHAPRGTRRFKVLAVEPPVPASVM